MSAPAYLETLRDQFGTRLQENVSLKRFTAARIGGNADVMITVNSAGELEQATRTLWENQAPFIILGSGSNVLVADRGVRQVVVLNRAKETIFHVDTPHTSVWAESGANLGTVARLAASQGLSGLEWATSIPGTVGGAVYGNAGAHGGDISGTLVVASILHLRHVKVDDKPEVSKEEWPVDRFIYGYRSSLIKRQPGRVVVLSAELKLSKSTSESVKAKMEEYRQLRQNSQPTGASMGSIFKNPEGDYAGRLIEAAGLKGTAIGNVEISRKHANFFINHDNALADDYLELIRLAQQKVFDQFGVRLELEIELIGDWTEWQG